jgi:rare lipoprotein A
MHSRLFLLLIVLPIFFSCGKKAVETTEVYEEVISQDGYVKDGQTQVGIASWYGIEEHHRYAASGERFSKHAYTAAHKSLPMGTVVRVTNLENGRDVVVKINDRGPFVQGRIIDLSHAPAQSIGMIAKGTVEVKVEVLSTPSSRGGSYFEAQYTVQVGSFRERPVAIEVKRKLDIEYEDVRVESIKVRGDNYFRVRVGRYTSEGEAKKAASKLRRRGYRGNIILE